MLTFSCNPARIASLFAFGGESSTFRLSILFFPLQSSFSHEFPCPRRTSKSFFAILRFPRRCNPLLLRPPRPPKQSWLGIQFLFTTDDTHAILHTQSYTRNPACRNPTRRQSHPQPILTTHCLQSCNPTTCNTRRQSRQHAIPPTTQSCTTDNPADTHAIPLPAIRVAIPTTHEPQSRQHAIPPTRNPANHTIHDPHSQIMTHDSQTRDYSCRDFTRREARWCGDAASASTTAARTDCMRRIHGSKWFTSLNSITECEVGSARSVYMRSAMLTRLNVGIVAGAPGLGSVCTSLPLVPRAP